MSGSSENRKLPENPILITGGDPAGIGPELIEKIAPLLAESGRAAVIYATGGRAHRDNLEKILKSLKVDVRRGSAQSEIPGEGRPGGPGPVWIEAIDESEKYRQWAARQNEIKPGEPGLSSGMLAFLALERACEDIPKFPRASLLTAPLSKSWAAEALGGKFPGHTDYLASRFQREVLMIMHSTEISVIPLTIHVPLAAVSRELQRLMERPATGELLQNLRQSGMFPGRWALCGINPHAGENGHLGREELDFMEAAAAGWRNLGLPVDGPLPGDVVFQPEERSKYRLVLAAYHDQGLGPFKALVGRRGINVTWGLPFLRASPDHGTAFGIAGKGTADPTSMAEALKFLLFAGGHPLPAGTRHGP